MLDELSAGRLAEGGDTPSGVEAAGVAADIVESRTISERWSSCRQKPIRKAEIKQGAVSKWNVSGSGRGLLEEFLVTLIPSAHSTLSA